MTAPCDVCRRCHRGPRCKPAEDRSVSMCITFPAHVATALRERLAWGERSAFVARAVDAALEQTGGAS